MSWKIEKGPPNNGMHRTALRAAADAEGVGQAKDTEEHSMNDELARERKSTTVSVILTVASIPCVVGPYLQGPEQIALIASVAFMLGYIVERVRLHRRIAGLLSSNIGA